MSIETVVGGGANAFMFDPALKRCRARSLSRSRRFVSSRPWSSSTPRCRTTDRIRLAGVRPRDLQSLADIAEFPYTLKADLRDNYPFGMSAVPRESCRVRTHRRAPPGSRPSWAIPEETSICWADLMARSIACMGACPERLFTTPTDMASSPAVSAPISGSGTARLHCRAHFGRRH